MLTVLLNDWEVSAFSNMSAVTHISVLLEQSIALLEVKPTDVLVDGTFGGGGHSSALRTRYPSINLICVDLDEAAQKRFDDLSLQATFVHANFKDADYILEQAKLTYANKVLLDLGTSTFQLLEDTRGFSFNSNAPLSMAFSSDGSHTGFNAYDIVNTWEESSIADIIYGYGEERSARKIARIIVEARAIAPITTSLQLAEVISSKIPRRGRIHPATKTFQALRIAVNDELGTIKAALDAWWQKIPSGGRIVVITFHSLEDRVVKHWIMAQTDGRNLTKKPFVPDEQELKVNPRARSAKLRGIEKL
jgi:16S rRNA (cytosine1402-N4)-methyltransferase